MHFVPTIIYNTSLALLNSMAEFTGLSYGPASTLRTTHPQISMTGSDCKPGPGFETMGFGF